MNSRGHARGDRIVLIIMVVLAVCGVALTWATAKNYLGAATAAAGFQTTVSGVTLRQEGSGYTIEINVSFENLSEWDLPITAVRSIVYLDGQYIWGRNYEWWARPLELPGGSKREVVLEIDVPDTKIELVAGGKEAWSIRISGLLDMPRLGTKVFVTNAVVPLDRGNEA